MSAPAKSIVITSIFAPTKAVYAFSQLAAYQLIIVGDKKTPPAWQVAGAAYLSVEQQEQLGFRLTEQLPYNHYGRKMVGYLQAMRQGAEIIIDTDDDNIPYAGWSFPAMSGTFAVSAANKGFVNIYKNFTSHHVWPRGYPLALLLHADHRLQEEELMPEAVQIGIWQGLADSDPDVDAIYRLVDNTEIFFNKRAPIVLNVGTLCPFNSQNTAVRRELFPLLYLPAYVTFRFTDILRGLVAQPIMWAAGYRLGFTEATVLQERNPHDYVKDFESEIPCYLYPEKVVAVVSARISPASSVAQNLAAAYTGLYQAGIVPAQELQLLDLWLHDIGELAVKAE